MKNEAQIKYSTKKVPDWAFDSGLEVASQIGCDSNAGEDSEVLLSVVLHSVRCLTKESASDAFAAELEEYDKPAIVYRLDWTVWVCKSEFDIDDPWLVSCRDDYLYLVEDELRDADFTNYGMGCNGRFLEWSQNSGECFDASIGGEVPDDVIDGVCDLIPEWGYKVAEWFGGDDEKLSAKHPLLTKMLPRFRKVVMATIRDNR